MSSTMRIGVTCFQLPDTRVDLGVAKFVPLANATVFSCGNVWTAVEVGGGTVGDWEHSGPLHLRGTGASFRGEPSYRACCCEAASSWDTGLPLTNR